MSPENTQKLYTAFPRLYRERLLPLSETGMCWGFECGDGWFDLLWQLSQALEGEARQQGLNPDADEWPCATQVKEKFGGLRFYMRHETSAMTALIENAETLSERTCDVCGQSGIQSRSTSGWISVKCVAHTSQTT